MQMVHYTKCPVCENINISLSIGAKDETVSKQTFEIWQCSNCKLRFTQDVPDEKSIGYFYKSTAYISHSNKQKGFMDRVYYLVRNYTLQQKKKLVKKYSHKQTGDLLDIGAGTGAFLSTMKNSGWDVIGLEPDESARQNAKKDFDTHLMPTENLFRLSKSSFDVVTMWHVLEHVHQLHDYVDTINSLLVNDGILIIAVPNYTSYDAGKYEENWAAYDVPRHLYHFSPESMHALLKKHNFKIIDQRQMWFDSFYVSLLSEKYKTGKSNFLNAFKNGLLSNIKAAGKPENCSSIIYIAKK